MPSIKIRVGASLDSNVLSMWQPAEKAAARAAQNIARELQRSAQQRVASEAAANRQIERDLARLEKEKVREVANAAKARQSAEREATKAAEREAGARAKAEDKAARDKSKALDREVADAKRAGREQARATRQAYEEIERDLERHNRRQEQEARRAAAEARRSSEAAAHGRQRTRDAIGRGIMNVGGRALSFGGRIGRDVISGMGVETNLSTLVEQGVQLESAAVQLSNAGYISPAAGGKGANAVRQDPRELIRQAREVGTATAYSPNEAIGGLAKFTAKTGDLATGRDVLKDLAVLSKATGANLDDMVDAAGDVANDLGDVENKGRAVVRVMQAIAGQGKLGAVEVKDLAKQMAGLAAVAPQFEGNAEDNIALMGALAQEARARGTAKSAPQAVTAVQSLVGTFAKGARRKEFEALGIRLDSTREPGKLRNPEEIILEAIEKTGGRTDAMNKLFMDRQAQRAVQGFTSIYHEAGGGQAGLKAVADEFERMKRATMQQTEIQQSFSAAMKTSESQAQIFNNKLGETADQLRIALLPALKDLAPAAIALAGAFTAVIGKLTGATEEKKQITYEDALKHAKEARESGDPVKIRAAQKEVEQVLGQHEKARYDLRHPDEQYNSLGFRKDTPFWMYATGLAGIDSVPTKLVRDNLPGMDIPGLGYVGGSLERKRNEMSAEDWRIDQLKEEQHATSQALANLVSGLLRDGLKIQNLPPQGPTPQPPGAGFGGVMPPGAR